MDKEQAIRICENLRINAREDIQEVTFQYLTWNKQLNYETKTFEWLMANAVLLASLKEQSADELLIELLKKITTYQDAVKMMKDPYEVKQFNSFTNVVPLFS
ncbi:hypothetical protein AB3N04_01310 [Alkalihalophilus sp. As8PL]|uniref:Uncharacterized protein n=1 Tax=Alkalihalophilus sp. As8PL TaxID=3237103 RepID=A0AB39BT99_9BACI